MKEKLTPGNNSLDEAINKAAIKDEKINKSSIDDLDQIVVDACGPLVSLRYHNKFSSFDEIKNEFIPKLTTLEKFITNAPRYKSNYIEVIKEIKTHNPNVFSKYDDIVNLLKNPELKPNEFIEILDKAKELY